MRPLVSECSIRGSVLADKISDQELLFFIRMASVVLMLFERGGSRNLSVRLVIGQKGDGTNLHSTVG